MASKLSDYERKRDFSATPEPAGTGAPSSGDLPRFVVQEHSATRLHWDLRLEHDGVAMSWAIPNGIPADPAENRKAVHTEDHPLEYLDFEGEIPEGQYGVGTMRIWDRGTYEPHSFDERKVVVTFHGERVRGRYALFQAGGDRDWLIHRMDPPEQPRDPFPERIVPMAARLGKLPADADGWGVEVKWDGVRAIAYCQPGRIRLESRNLNDIGAQYPELRDLVRALGAREAVLDGEIVAFDADGRPSFAGLQQRMHQTSESVIRRRMKSHPVVYVIFDLLYLDGSNLMGEPYGRRRELLRGLGLEGERWQVPEHALGDAERLLAASAEQGLEGLVLKRLDSPYEPGKRTGAWLKVKNTARQELVIGGWEPGEGRRRSTLGALLVGYYEQDGGARPALRYAGKVGTGFSERQLAALIDSLRDLERADSPFEGRQPDRGAVFAEPELVAEVEFREWTPDGLLRHPSFKGLRDDKAAADVRLELPAEVAEAALVSRAADDRVVYRGAGFTTADAAAYYARVAPVLLPHLHGRRPIAGRSPEPDGGLVVDDAAALVGLAERGDVELRAPLATVERPDRPTALVLGLAPVPPAGPADCAEIALLLRDMLERLGLHCYPKTAASGAIELYAPLQGGATHEQTRQFAQAVAETFERQLPERVVAARPRARKRGRVVIDWTPNAADEAPLAPYSLIAGERPSVSAPLTWSEVESARDSGGAALELRPDAVVERVERDGDHFAVVLGDGQPLPRLGG